MNGQSNSWIFWIIAAAAVIYFVGQSQATSAANAAQTGVPPGSRVSGSTVLNAQGQVIGSVTSAGYYAPAISTTQAASNPLTAATIVNQTPLPLSGCAYSATGQLLYCS